MVPAAGHAGRLGSSISGSKELQVVAGRPVIEYLLERMDRAGATETRVVTRPEKADIRAHAGNLGATIVLGRPSSASASVALGLSGLNEDDVVLVGFPDTVWEPADGFAILAHAVESGDAGVVLGLFDFDEPSRSHVVETDRAGRVVSLAIRPPAPVSHRVWGCLAARARLLEPMKEHRSLGSFLLDVLGREKVAGNYLSDVFVDIGTPETLAFYRSVGYEGLCARARARAVAEF